ncbi:hypothetical protein OCU04_006876 [Sclerotinia nivalis]|uniref:AA9 family lytic polysaccharide monooxygenase n=1 Tax=Sclerotinia nivalis TaxID=352851 RepID=A0A9X0DIB0_9HELO|nr:hypothetical protein OCU04_006876 [Sclerotinia nivalis]
MHQQSGDKSCTIEAIGGAHYGPIILYISKISNATTDTGSGSWFRVNQEEYNVTRQWWGSQTLNANCGKRSFIIPSTLALGACLLRARSHRFACSRVGRRRPTLHVLFST